MFIIILVAFRELLYRHKILHSSQTSQTSVDIREYGNNIDMFYIWICSKRMEYWIYIYYIYRYVPKGWNIPSDKLGINGSGDGVTTISHPVASQKFFNALLGKTKFI